MNKQEFLESIRSQLRGLPEEDIEKSLDYYAEMIEDRVEDGLTEEEAVEAMGTPEEVASQILMDTSFTKLVKAKVNPKKRLSVWAIVLIILGSPIWLSLAVAVLAIILSVYMVLWSVILVLYAIDLSMAACALSGLVCIAAFLLNFAVAESILMFGISLVCAGLAVLMFFGFNQVTKGMLFISKKIALGIKSCFIKRRVA